MSGEKPNYLIQFPSFEDEKLPNIPSTWTDDSWRNDACPCWTTESGLTIYIDYEKVENREHEMLCRFSVIDHDAGTTGKTVLDTDDWGEVLLATGDTVP